jgi:hypothetical protein
MEHSVWIRHTLILGFRQKDVLGFQTNDGTVSIESMLAPLAQQQAFRVIGLKTIHQYCSIVRYTHCCFINRGRELGQCE